MARKPHDGDAFVILPRLPIQRLKGAASHVTRSCTGKHFSSVTRHKPLGHLIFPSTSEQCCVDHSLLKGKTYQGRYYPTGLCFSFDFRVCCAGHKHASHFPHFQGAATFVKNRPVDRIKINFRARTKSKTTALREITVMQLHNASLPRLQIRTQRYTCAAHGANALLHHVAF
ncbi:MAG: hypothetical protein L7F78_00955 [Syntrophales bacterium LBB04]|nr:hypothetical protein [Syntrophales bacterium LBB04]